MIRICSLIILCFFCFSCVREKSLHGIYAAKHFTKTLDTLILTPDNYYKHKVFNKNTGELIIYDSGFWKLVKGKVMLNNFTLNEDDISFKKDANYLKLNRFLDVESIFTKNLIIWEDMNYYYKKVE